MWSGKCFIYYISPKSTDFDKNGKETSTFQQLLAKDDSVTIHDRNIQKLAVEMYKVKHDILPCPITEFISKRDNYYNIRKGSDFERKRHKKVLCGSE